MSTNRKVKEQNEKPSFGLLLGTGIAFVLIGSFLLIARMANLEVRLYSYRYLVWSFIGGFLLFFSIVKVRRKTIMFSGIFLILTGMLFFAIDTGFIPFTLESLWPVVVIIGGLSLFVSGVCIHKGVKSSLVIPSFALVLLGGCCLLFSLNIITEPFLQLASRWWPLVLIAAGLFLVVLFFIRNTNKIELDDVEDDFNDLDDAS